MADESSDSGRSRRDGGRGSMSAQDLTVAAMDAIGELTGYTPEAVTALQWDGDSWLVTVDALELERVPSTTDVLGRYVVQLDDDGGLLGYRRTRRLQRAQVDDEE